MALAWVGRLDDAERALRLAFEKKPTAFIAYRFGSVLAEQRKFAEANAAFRHRRPPSAMADGGSMHSIVFPEGKMTCARSMSPSAEPSMASLTDRPAIAVSSIWSRPTRAMSKRFARALHSSLAAVRAKLPPPYPRRQPGRRRDTVPGLHEGEARTDGHVLLRGDRPIAASRTISTVSIMRRSGSLSCPRCVVTTASR